MSSFSTEQFHILAAMRGNARGASFAQCTARFKGQRDPVAVEEFLSAISVYKDIEKVSDANALRGMTLLLEEQAASWWIDVKDSVRTFDQAISLIRTTFAPVVSDWQIFSKFFEVKQQKAEATDSFICKKRLLLSQLKIAPTETIQLNMVYGLLNINIREQLRLENVRTFQELISASREVEMRLSETPGISEDKKETVNRNRCGFCRNRGHTIENCHRKQKRDEQQNSQQPVQQPLNQPRQHPDLKKKPSFSCYGCGAPEVYRSNCPTCNKSDKNNSHNLSSNSLSSTIVGSSLPKTHVEFFGHKEEAIFDSGAKTNIASPELKQILEANNCVFQDVRAEIILADGSVSSDNVMSTYCDVIIGKRVRKIRLIYLPNATKNKTLIGADFLEQAGIVLNMAQKYWYFEDEPKHKFLFTNLMERNLHSKTPSSFVHHDNLDDSQVLIEDKSVSKSLESQQLDNLYSSPVGLPYGVDYYPQYVQSILRNQLPVEENTPRNSNVFEPPAKSRKMQQNANIHDLTSLFLLDIKILKESDNVGFTTV